MTALTPSPLGEEALDTPGCDPAVARATLADIQVVNRLFGGRQAAAWGLRQILRTPLPDRPLTLLDVASGSGDVAAHLARMAARWGTALRPVGLDRHRTAAALCRQSGLPAMVADAGSIPVPPAGVDIVLVSQFLHHLDRNAAARLLRELDALARVGVIVADARRSLGALVGIQVATRVLGCHPATRHDGALSVRRSFTRGELAHVLAAAGIRGRVWRRPGFRLVAAWRTDHAHR